MAIEFVFTLILRIEQGCENFPRKENEKEKYFHNIVLKIVLKVKKKREKEEDKRKLKKS